MAGESRTGEASSGIWSRRDFMSLTGWASVLGALGGATLMWVRFMYPRVNFDPPTVFKAGPPSDYPVNEVSDKYIPTKRTWIVRAPEGLVAVYAQCTHLGCTPRWFKAEDKFKCPCHGSGFRGVARGLGEVATNFEGPAPRPLERCTVELAEDGEIVVDFGRRFKRNASVNEFDKPGASLKV